MEDNYAVEAFVQALDYANDLPKLFKKTVEDEHPEDKFMFFLKKNDRGSFNET